MIWSLLQWFGNIVTMQWWDDLWLNEGFASFMQYLGLQAFNNEWSMVYANNFIIFFNDLRMAFSTLITLRSGLTSFILIRLNLFHLFLINNRWFLLYQSSFDHYLYFFFYFRKTILLRKFCRWWTMTSRILKL